jgi:hypothetical protein
MNKPTRGAYLILSLLLAVIYYQRFCYSDLFTAEEGKETAAGSAAETVRQTTQIQTRYILIDSACIACIKLHPLMNLFRFCFETHSGIWEIMF